MNLLKRSELLLIKEQSMLPVIPMPTLTQNDKSQRGPMDRKESDFIKRLKKTKSIMIAQKNRKQKNILNPYFMDNRKRKSNEALTMNSNNNTSFTCPKDHSIDSKQQKLQKFLFPPVHSSIQICLNTCKKIASRDLKIDHILSQPVNIGENLSHKNRQKNVQKIINMVKNQQQGPLKMGGDKKEQSQTERQNVNFTQVKQRPENGYKSQKKLQTVKPYLKAKIPRQLFKYYRNLTEESPHWQEDRLMGWDFRRDDEHEIM